MRLLQRMLLIIAVSIVAAPLVAAEPKSKVNESLVEREAEYYKINTFALPKGVVLEAGAICLLPEKKVAFATRRGEIFVIENAWSKDPADAKYVKFAAGLHEILGLAFKDGAFYAVQRPEVTRLTDENGDGRADLFETFSDGWDISGDYHEFTFGSDFDKDGNLWVTLCLTGSFSSQAKFRGWALRITPEGKVIPTTSGIRSPGGVGFNSVGDVFYTDNQGPWNGSCSLKHLIPGRFVGHPGGFNWYDFAPEMKKPQEPESGSRWAKELAKIPQLVPPVCWFPYPKMGQSASGIVCDTSAGKFGPFQDQLFVGDQTQAMIMRVALEKVNGYYQGALFPFRSGFASGTLSVKLDGEGSMFVGGTSRGWGARGTQPYSFERLDWTGKTPFEILSMHALPDGFELKFTEPVDSKTAGDPASYKLQTYTYIYQSSYGSPEVDHTSPKIQSAVVSKDGRSVKLTINGLVPGHVHELHSDGVRSANDAPLLHAEAYYTLNFLPKP
jgi:glucose/arabinose dehydrogenase